MQKSQNQSQAKSMNPDEMIQFRKKHFLPTAALYHKNPMHLVKAQGEYVWDAEGKKYLDAIGGIVCISAGHNHPKIKRLYKFRFDQALKHFKYFFTRHRFNNIIQSFINDVDP